MGPDLATGNVAHQTWGYPFGYPRAPSDGGPAGGPGIGVPGRSPVGKIRRPGWCRGRLPSAADVGGGRMRITSPALSLRGLDPGAPREPAADR
ncbi:hypothetical protein FRAHR75_150105 [Frankia sp. Hr75.2]|nr:hypothetical protein FRAHR75_150105 [Frankia sp. Hr75.2]SQD96641.1 hypothetical protein FMEAI12_3670038 [Parafrankia sp. Ea1.12]